ALLGQRLVARHDDRERAGVPARDEAAGWAVAEVLHRDGEGVGNALRDGGGGEVARDAAGHKLFGRAYAHFGDRQVNRGGGDVLVGRRGVVVLVDLGHHMGAIDRDGPFVVAWGLVDVVEADNRVCALGKAIYLLGLRRNETPRVPRNDEVAGRVVAVVFDFRAHGRGAAGRSRRDKDALWRHPEVRERRLDHGFQGRRVVELVGLFDGVRRI